MLNVMFCYLGVMRVLDDDVAVERGAVVHLENCGKAGKEYGMIVVQVLKQSLSN